jgi:hypothetical protein
MPSVSAVGNVCGPPSTTFLPRQRAEDEEPQQKAHFVRIAGPMPSAAKGRSHREQPPCRLSHLFIESTAPPLAPPANDPCISPLEVYIGLRSLPPQPTTLSVYSAVLSGAYRPVAEGKCPKGCPKRVFGELESCVGGGHCTARQLMPKSTLRMRTCIRCSTSLCVFPVPNDRNCCGITYDLIYWTSAISHSCCSCGPD